MRFAFVLCRVCAAGAAFLLRGSGTSIAIPTLLCIGIAPNTVETRRKNERTQKAQNHGESQKKAGKQGETQQNHFRNRNPTTPVSRKQAVTTVGSTPQHCVLQECANTTSLVLRQPTSRRRSRSCTPHILVPRAQVTSSLAALIWRCSLHWDEFPRFSSAPRTGTNTVANTDALEGASTTLFCDCGK